MIGWVLLGLLVGTVLTVIMAAYDTGSSPDDPDITQ